MAIMAHQKREHHVRELVKKLPNDTPIIWDQKNDRWDTGRRAMLSYDLAADKHLVIQDDAVLCRNFANGVAKALAATPDVPVSFYTGKTQPHASEIKQAVARAIEHDRPFFSMQGPLWGVAVAVPTAMIEDMVKYCDRLPHPNYDLRMTEFFQQSDIDCWYSVPSLVNHRVGPDNPSLVPNRTASMKRTAHAWIDKKDPRKIDWSNGCLPWLGPNRRTWKRTMDGYQCGNCGEVFKRLPDIINHHVAEHSLGPVDFIATTPESHAIMKSVIEGLDREARGELFVIGKGGISPLKAKRTLSRRPKRFTVADCYQTTRYATAGRTIWSMDNKAEVNG